VKRLPDDARPGEAWVRGYLASGGRHGAVTISGNSRRRASPLRTSTCKSRPANHAVAPILARLASVAISFAALAWAADALALMAGVAPDSPAARIDPNVATSKLAGVGAIVFNGGTYSGVVIARQYVLTAGHVGAGAAPSAMSFILNLTSTPWISGVESVSVYPTFNFPYDDLAVLKLSTPVPENVPIYPMFTGTATTGLQFVLAGYGSSGNGNVGVTVAASSTVKRSGGNVIDVLQAAVDSSGQQSRFYIYDFDGPTGSGPLGGPTIGNSVETLVAPGDSGGPAFVSVAGNLHLFGINTFVSPAVSGGTVNYEFGTYGGGIVASDARFSAWLQSATNATMPGDSIDTGNAPLPLWSLLILGGGMLGIAHVRRSRRGLGRIESARE
jgi:Trypsin